MTLVSAAALTGLGQTTFISMRNDETQSAYLHSPLRHTEEEYVMMAAADFTRHFQSCRGANPANLRPVGYSVSWSPDMVRSFAQADPEHPHGTYMVSNHVYRSDVIEEIALLEEALSDLSKLTAVEVKRYRGLLTELKGALAHSWKLFPKEDDNPVSWLVTATRGDNLNHSYLQISYA